MRTTQQVALAIRVNHIHEQRIYYKCLYYDIYMPKNGRVQLE